MTLLTDFGTRDPYVGVMKGVILGLAPATTVVDLTHEVAPQAIAEAALLLEGSWRYFPAGTVHVVVVDPGVGTERAVLAVASSDHLFVGPDNGVLGACLEAASEICRVEDPRWFREEISPVFHGRDVFAPLAAHLAAGRRLREVGRPMADPVRPRWTRPRRVGRELVGEVVHIDRFGNLISSIGRSELGDTTGVTVRIGGRNLGPIRRTYADVDSGCQIALIGSLGLLEVAVRDGSAAAVLGAARGTAITVEWPSAAV